MSYTSRGFSGRVQNICKTEIACMGHKFFTSSIDLCQVSLVWHLLDLSIFDK